MNSSAASAPTGAVPLTRTPEPALWTILLIFWTAFAGAVAVTAFFNPQMFQRQDPDDLMRLVQVRDLLGGQNWFDLVQHRIDPPRGVLMHWSRLIDAPIAGLVLIGNLFGDGERFALTLWPLLLLLGFMASAMGIAVSLAGRRAAVPAIVLSLLFPAPLLSFMPNSIDHHNAQLMLMMATLALAMRLPAGPVSALAAGFGAALMLAIGLEMLPYAATFGIVIAVRWAIGAQGGRTAALFGVAFAAGLMPLQMLFGSPQSLMACDSLSLAYALPAAIGGCGLAALTLILPRDCGAPLRLAALGLVGAAAATTFAFVSPDCLAGPLGFLSPELKALWLDNITEAQSVLRYVRRDPLAMMATLGPPLVALLVALRRARPGGGSDSALWVWPAALIGVAILMCLYQVRTLPYANAVAIPVLAAWLAELAARRGITSLRPVGPALPVVAAALLAMPLAHYAAGWTAIRAVSLATGGRVAPPERPALRTDLVAGLSGVQRECIDVSSAALFASVPPGLVLVPVLYGSAVLALSPHAVVAAPYHRGGSAILDAIHAMTDAPETAHAIVTTRNVDYIAICAASPEAANNMHDGPDGLLARLLAGEEFAWLRPVAPTEATALRLWRVVP